MSELGPVIHSKYFYFAILLVLASAVYWILYSNFAYNTFLEGSDAAFFVFNMYYDIHFTWAVHGLQFLIFGQHIAPDQLLILPIFFVFQSALTLLYVQAIILSLTGLAIYIIARDLLKNEWIAIFFCVAYILNVGLLGLYISGYHPEMLIIPLYVLVFYFYMKVNWRMFLPSLVLLLFTTESAPLLVVPLGVGLVIYEKLYRLEPNLAKKRLRFAYVMIAAALVALLIDNLIYLSLVPSYSGTSYSGLPAVLQEVSYPLVPIYNAASNSLISGYGTHSGEQTPSWLPTAVFALMVGLFSFGLGILFDPLSTLLFASPWLIMLFGFKSPGFASVAVQYFSFVLGGTFSANMLGLRLAMEKRSWLSGYFGKITGGDYRKLVTPFILVPGALIVLTTLASALVFLQLSSIPNPVGRFFFVTTVPALQNYSQLDYVISKVPPNASLATESIIMDHVATRETVEDVEVTRNIYTAPDYILVDYSSSLAENWYNTWQSEEFNEYMAYSAAYTGITYTPYMQEGTAILYKKS